MGAKQSEETRQAMRLYLNGDTLGVASKKAGVYPSTLWRALKTAGNPLRGKAKK